MYILITIIVAVVISLGSALWLLRIPGNKSPYTIYGESAYKNSLLKLKGEYSKCANKDETLAFTIRFLSQLIECEPHEVREKYFKYLKEMNYSETELYTLVKKYSLLTRVESHELKISDEMTPSEILSDLTYYFIEKVIDKAKDESEPSLYKKAA